MVRRVEGVAERVPHCIPTHAGGGVAWIGVWGSTQRNRRHRGGGLPVTRQQGRVERNKQGEEEDEAEEEEEE